MVAPEAPVLLAAHGLSLGYGGAPVLRDVDLTVRAGEFWFLLGRNGEGKTTFVRAALGELAPLAGQLTLHPSLRDRAAVAFVPQRCTPNQILPTTVREFVGLGLVGVRADAAARRERIAWALAHAGLVGRETQSYWTWSGGQRQRALVARALVRRPRLLLLDEPTNHLDAAIERGVLDLLEGLRREEGTALLFVTHARHLAERYATHLAYFQGSHVEAGPAATLWQSERLTRGDAATEAP